MSPDSSTIASDSRPGFELDRPSSRGCRQRTARECHCQRRLSRRFRRSDSTVAGSPSASAYRPTIARRVHAATARRPLRSDHSQRGSGRRRRVDQRDSHVDIAANRSLKARASLTYPAACWAPTRRRTARFLREWQGRVTTLIHGPASAMAMKNGTVSSGTCCNACSAALNRVPGPCPPRPSERKHAGKVLRRNSHRRKLRGDTQRLVALSLCQSPVTGMKVSKARWW